jgi:YaiO family outer membrane protein
MQRQFQRILPLIFIVFAATPSRAQETVAAARKSALSGDRRQALELLSHRLEEAPGDTDARILYGTVLSWDGNLPQARKELQRVLQESPHNGDAMQALANVELWSDHPDKAEDLVAEVLKGRPNDTDLLYARVKALTALKRPKEAGVVLNRLLEIDPGNKDALRLRGSLSSETPLWQGLVQQYFDWFDDSIGNRSETQLSLKRQTSVGSVIGRYANAQGFGLVGNQVEVDFYPGLRKGTYAYLNVGYSPDAHLYPRYRLGTDIFQTLSHGFEGSAGYRQLGFSTKVNIFTTALSKYKGAWLFTGRGYFTPDLTGTSQSFQLSARRYAGDSASYFELRYGHGSTPAEVRSLIDIGILNSNSFEGSFTKRFRGRWQTNGALGVSREDRVNRPTVDHYTANAGLSYRF